MVTRTNQHLVADEMEMSRDGGRSSLHLFPELLPARSSVATPPVDVGKSVVCRLTMPKVKHVNEADVR